MADYQTRDLITIRAICAGMMTAISCLHIPPDLLLGYVVIVEGAPDHQAISEAIGASDWYVGSPRAWQARERLSLTKLQYSQARAQAVARIILTFRALGPAEQAERVQTALAAYEERFHIDVGRLPAGWDSRNKRRKAA